MRACVGTFGIDSFHPTDLIPNSPTGEGERKPAMSKTLSRLRMSQTDPCVSANEPFWTSSSKAKDAKNHQLHDTCVAAAPPDMKPQHCSDSLWEVVDEFTPDVLSVDNLPGRFPLAHRCPVLGVVVLRLS